jgi:hypothetical protein
MQTRLMWGTRAAILPPDGPLLDKPADASELIGLAWSEEAGAVVVPVVRLSPDFFRLRTGLAGEFFQKFQNYGLRLVVVGDISAYLAASGALRDFVRETNRVGHHRFVADAGELDAPA